MSNLHDIELAVMAMSEDETERAIAAKNPATPEYLLLDLADDDDEEVRSCVARNPAATEHLLQELSKDDSEWVCRCVGRNEKTPIDTVLSLLPCSKAIPSQRATYIKEIFDIHKQGLLQKARSGSLDFNMLCVDGETLKEGLIDGNRTEIYNLLLAEQLAGKTERLADNSSTPQQEFPSRRI